MGDWIVEGFRTHAGGFIGFGMMAGNGEEWEYNQLEKSN